MNYNHNLVRVCVYMYDYTHIDDNNDINGNMYK